MCVCVCCWGLTRLIGLNGASYCLKRLESLLEFGVFGVGGLRVLGTWASGFPQMPKPLRALNPKPNPKP